MKGILLRAAAVAILVFSSSALTLSAAGQNIVAAVPATVQPSVVDTWGQVGEAVSNGADGLGKVTDVVKGILMDKKTAGALVEKVSAALAKIPGMPSGRILQIKILKGLGKAAGAIDSVVTSVTSAVKIVDAANSGDREAYKKAFADYIITMTAKVVGVAVGDATVAGLTAATVGLGTLPAVGVGMLAGTAAEATTKWLLKKFAKDAIENLAGKYYDWATGTGGKEGKNPGTGGDVTTDDLDGLGDGDSDGPKGSEVKGIKAHKWGGG